MHRTITAKDWLHVLLIWGEDLKAKETAGKKGSRFIAAFLSPPEKEMWRLEGKRLVQYVWRSSAVQLQPDLAMANSGGMSAHVVHGVLELRAHGTAFEQSTSIKIDMRKRLVETIGLSTRLEDPNGSDGTVQQVVGNPDQTAEDENALGMSELTSTLRMRLTDLKCYRLPGEASKVTR